MFRYIGLHACLLFAFPASFSGACTAKTWKSWPVQKESFCCSYFGKFLIRMIGKALVIFFGLESVGKIWTIYTAAVNWGSFGTAEHRKKHGNSEFSVLLAKWDGTKEHLHDLSRWLFSRLLQYSDRFYYVTLSVSSLVLTQQKQKYQKENTGRGKKEMVTTFFSKLSFCGALWTTQHALFKRRQSTPQNIHNLHQNLVYRIVTLKLWTSKKFIWQSI